VYVIPYSVVLDKQARRDENKKACSLHTNI
jgi:hypothetical protein